MTTLADLENLINKGYKIFPLFGVNPDGSCICYKGSQCESQGKHPFVDDGFKSATNDIEQVRYWFNEKPNCNWAIRTGEESGITVIDIDPRNGGSLADYPFPETLQVKTGGGGYHLYYQYSPDVKVGKFAQGIDIKNDGGYVVAPPSKHKSQNRYEFINDADLVPFPLELLKNEPKSIVRLSEGKIEQGTRNETLFKIASSLRGSGREDHEIFEKVWSENLKRCEPPLDEAEVRGIVKSTSKYPPNEYQASISHTNPNTPNTKTNDIDEDKNTDVANAERLVKLYGNKIRYSYSYGKYLVWDGKRWLIDDGSHIRNFCIETAKSIYKEALEESNNKESQSLGKWAYQSQSQGKINAMEDLAKSMVTIDSKELDNHPTLLNCKNGIINLTTGELLPHNPKYYLTKYVDVDYLPDADCPKWKASLEFLIPDKEVRKFLQKALGYSLTGLTDEQCLFFLYGTGANGKTTIMETIKQLMNDYSQRTDINSLLETKRGGEATPYIAKLVNTRLVISSEIPEGRKIDASLIKDLTGGDTITARDMYKSPVDFTATHKLWLVGNYEPKVRDMSLGFWRRMRLIQFEVTIPKENQRELSVIKREFMEEKSGILAWLIQGALLWKTEGLIPPEKIKRAVEQYRTESDIFQQFLDEETERGADHQKYRIRKNAFQQALTTYLKRNGEEPFSNQKIGKELAKRNINLGGTDRAFYLGIRLNQYQNDFYE